MRTKTGKASYKLNNLTGDFYTGCDKKLEITVQSGAPVGLKMGEVVVFKYLSISDSMKPQSATFLEVKE